MQETIKKGSKILNVYAITTPSSQCDRDDGCEVHLGSIKLLTDLHTSVFGDEQLYFQHRRVN